MFETERLSVIGKFIGPHVQTDDFLFQQKLRGLELTIQQIASKHLGDKKAENFFILGWGLVIGAAYLLEKNPAQLKISNAFKEVLQKGIQQVIFQGQSLKNPILSKNVLENTGTFMMHKECSGLGFRPVSIGNTVQDLNAILPKFELKFTLNKETRLYLEIEPQFFNELWKGDFPALLSDNGFAGLEKNRECPHATLINSPAIYKIKEQCDIKYLEKGPQQFNTFISSILDKINDQLKQEENPVVFSSLSAKYTENYSPFEEIIVAYFHSPLVTKAMNQVVNEVQEKFQIQIDATKPENYHVTIAVKPREPEVLSVEATMESLISQTGPYSNDLNDFWETLTQKA